MSVKPSALHVRLDNIPVELRAISRWVMWSNVPRTKPNGKKVWAKMPQTVKGSPASSTNASTWSTFDDVAETLIMGGFDGIGLVLGEGLHGIDLDDCRDPVTGELSELATEVLDRVGGYAEVSPSGTGLKIFTPTNLDGSRTKKEMGVELYCDGRYFTVTGHVIDPMHADVASGPQDLSWFVRKVWDEDLSSAVPLSGDAAERALVLYKPVLEDWDLDRVAIEVLPHLDPDGGYEDWLRVGAAMHHQGEGAEDWLQAWDDWSAQSGKWVEGYCAEKWSSFSEQRSVGRGAVTLATLLMKTKNKRGITHATSWAKNRNVFELVPARDLICQPKNTVYLVEGLIEEGALGALVGATGTYKSFVAISLGASIATGTAWNDRKVQQGSVIMLAGEGHAGFSRRLKAWEIEASTPLDSAPFFFSRIPASLMDQSSLREVINAVDALIAAHGAPRMIIIDTLHRNFGPGDENSAGDMATVLTHLDSLRATYNCAILLVHHVGHAAKDRARGSSSFRAALDYEFLATVDGQCIRIESTKSKEAAPPSQMSFRPVEVELPWLDEHDLPIKSIVLHEIENSQVFKNKSLKGPARVALNSLKNALAKLEQGYVNVSEVCAGVSIEEWRLAAIAAGVSDAPTPDGRQKAFRRARQALMDEGVVTCINERYFVNV